MLMKRLASLGLLALLATHQAAAADLRDVLTDYSVASWSQKDGLPSGFVWSLAQDHEGYLWVGTDAGLFRFDGLRFVSWPGAHESKIPTASVRALLTSRDGTLWVGFGGGGGVAAIRDRHERVFESEDGGPAGAVVTILEDSAGTIWVGTSRGLYSFKANRWLLESLDPDAPGAIYSGYVDSHGQIFVTTATTIFRGDGHSGFEPVKKVSRVQSQFDIPRAITENADGEICTTDPVLGFRLMKSEANVRERERGRGSRLLRDSRGTLWVGTYGQGLWRVRSSDRAEQPSAERLSTATGLLSDGVMSLLEDRDGNIWVGTSEGLNRLTPHKVEQIVDLGIVIGIERSEDGEIWVANVDGLTRYPATSTDNARERTVVHGGHLRSLSPNPNGGLWIATDQLVSEFPSRLARHFSLVPKAPAEPVDSIASDGSDGIWIHTLNGSLRHWRSNRAEPFALPDRLRSGSVTASYTDSSGRAWFAFSGGELAFIDRQRTLRIFSTKNGAAAGEYRAIYEGHDHTIWLAGLAGLTRFSQGVFATLSAERMPAFGNLTAVVEDVDGGLWVGSTSGILHIAKGEFAAAIADPHRKVPYDKYDRSDGLAGVPGLYSNNRRAARANDGRLWFVTGRGITIIDPAILKASAKPRTVHIDEVVADRNLFSSSPVEFGSRAFEVNYGTLDLTSPLKSRFRYRLEGFEAKWVDAGSRRQAFYTNLPPGAYTFKVAASNADGSWSEAVPAWRIVITPRFYETAWFAALCLVALGLLLSGSWILHLRHVRRQFAALLGERTRISREIHDTLLQSLIGISLQFDVLGEDPTASPPHKARLTRMRKQVETYIREARQSIWNLRSPRLQADGLVEGLRRTGEEATEYTSVSFEFSIDGIPRPYAANAEEQLLRIGQEAVANAMRHAAAKQIAMELRYSAGELTLQVTDDGRGFDPIQMTAHPNGHYGLLSMRERAELAGGTLQIISAQGSGTRINASIPHGIA